MTKLKTPIDQLILRLSEITFNSPGKHNPLISLVQQQLLLLRTLHTEMLKNDLYEATKAIPQGERKISFKELVFNKPIDTNKAILNYLSFLSVLNQFGRILGKKHGKKLSEFPNYYRIRFYRNKVGEHWDDYISIISKKGLTFTKGKSAIPMIEEVLAPKDREKVRKQLNLLFIKSGLKLSIPEKYATTGAISSKGNYPNFMYETLEALDNKLEKRKIPDEIVILLFQFGFPAPICDVEEYLVQLSSYLINLLGLE